MGSTSQNYEASWEPDIAKRILSEAAESSSEKDRPYMVALVGIPGSGKSISTFLLANTLEEAGISVMICPHDGYHYPMEQLKQFPNPDDMIYRRGAPDTFDPQALYRDLERIRHGNDPMITVPGFDHAKGDPEPDSHVFDRSKHRVVICEGLYLLHDEDGWDEIAGIFDLKLFISSDVDACVERLKIRNLVIPGYTPEEIQIRCEKVDRVNAMTVMKSKDRADVVVKSIVSAPKQTSSSTGHKRVLSTDALNLMGTLGNEPLVDLHPDDQMGPTPTITDEPQPPEQQPPKSKIVGTWEKGIAAQIAATMKAQLGGSKKRPYMVGVVGMPGSGKSVSALILATELEALQVDCMIMPHDGYHYTIEYLKTLSNADDYIYRRGAPDTFDPQSLLRDLQRIRDSSDEAEEFIGLPAFDHAKAEPEPDKHLFNRSKHSVVICEGLYLLHNDNGWEDIATMLDYSIFLNSDLEICMDRVKIRNQCIPGYTPEEIAERVEKVDRVNALTVLKSKERANIVVNSLAMNPEN